MAPTRRIVLKARKRRSSNIVGLFSKQQIQEFREFFNLLDRNHTGTIAKEDVRALFIALGQDEVPEDVLEGMVADGQGPITFTVFLTMFAEHMKGVLNSAVALENAFRCLGLGGSNNVGPSDGLEEDQLCQLLAPPGGLLSEDDVRTILRDTEHSNGRVCVENLIKVLKCHTNEPKADSADKSGPSTGK